MTRFTNEILEHLGIDLPSEVSRRKFLKIFGGGIVVTVSANDLLALQEAPARRRFRRCAARGPEKGWPLSRPAFFFG